MQSTPVRAKARPYVSEPKVNRTNTEISGANAIMSAMIDRQQQQHHVSGANNNCIPLRGLIFISGRRAKQRSAPLLAQLFESNHLLLLLGLFEPSPLPPPPRDAQCRRATKRTESEAKTKHQHQQQQQQQLDSIDEEDPSVSDSERATISGQADKSSSARPRDSLGHGIVPSVTSSTLEQQHRSTAKVKAEAESERNNNNVQKSYIGPKFRAQTTEEQRRSRRQQRQRHYRRQVSSTGLEPTQLRSSENIEEPLVLSGDVGVGRYFVSHVANLETTTDEAGGENAKQRRRRRQRQQQSWPHSTRDELPATRSQLKREPSRHRRRSRPSADTEMRDETTGCDNCSVGQQAATAATGSTCHELSSKKGPTTAINRDHQDKMRTNSNIPPAERVRESTTTTTSITALVRHDRVFQNRERAAPAQVRPQQQQQQQQPSRRLSRGEATISRASHLSASSAATNHRHHRATHPASSNPPPPFSCSSAATQPPPTSSPQATVARVAPIDGGSSRQSASASASASSLPVLTNHPTKHQFIMHSPAATANHQARGSGPAATDWSRTWQQAAAAGQARRLGSASQCGSWRSRDDAWSPGVPTALSSSSSSSFRHAHLGGNSSASHPHPHLRQHRIRSPLITGPPLSSAANLMRQPAGVGPQDRRGQPPPAPISSFFQRAPPMQQRQQQQHHHGHRAARLWPPANLRASNQTRGHLPSSPRPTKMPPATAASASTQAAGRASESDTDTKQPDAQTLDRQPTASSTENNLHPLEVLDHKTRMAISIYDPLPRPKNGGEPTLNSWDKPDARLAARSRRQQQQQQDQQTKPRSPLMGDSPNSGYQIFAQGTADRLWREKCHRSAANAHATTTSQPVDADEVELELRKSFPEELRKPTNARRQANCEPSRLSTVRETSEEQEQDSILEIMVENMSDGRGSSRHLLRFNAATDSSSPEKLADLLYGQLLELRSFKSGGAGDCNTDKCDMLSLRKEAQSLAELCLVQLTSRQQQQQRQRRRQGPSPSGRSLQPKDPTAIHCGSPTATTTTDSSSSSCCCFQTQPNSSSSDGSQLFDSTVEGPQIDGASAATTSLKHQQQQQQRAEIERSLAPADKSQRQHLLRRLQAEPSSRDEVYAGGGAFDNATAAAAGSPNPQEAEAATHGSRRGSARRPAAGPQKPHQDFCANPATLKPGLHSEDSQKPQQQFGHTFRDDDDGDGANMAAAAGDEAAGAATLSVAAAAADELLEEIGTPEGRLEVAKVSPAAAAAAEVERRPITCKKPLAGSAAGLASSASKRSNRYHQKQLTSGAGRASFSAPAGAEPEPTEAKAQQTTTTKTTTTAATSRQSDLAGAGPNSAEESSSAGSIDFSHSKSVLDSSTTKSVDCGSLHRQQPLSQQQQEQRVTGPSSGGRAKADLGGGKHDDNRARDQAQQAEHQQQVEQPLGEQRILEQQPSGAGRRANQETDDEREKLFNSGSSSSRRENNRNESRAETEHDNMLTAATSKPVESPTSGGQINQRPAVASAPAPLSYAKTVSRQQTTSSNNNNNIHSTYGGKFMTTTTKRVTTK